jgi:sortase (surface protein transpeptidase)
LHQKRCVQVLSNLAHQGHMNQMSAHQHQVRMQHQQQQQMMQQQQQARNAQQAQQGAPSQSQSQQLATSSHAAMPSQGTSNGQRMGSMTLQQIGMMEDPLMTTLQ